MSPTSTASSPRSHPLSHVDEYLAIGQSAGASDIHLGVNAPPLWRLHGTLQPIWRDAPRLTSETTLAALVEQANIERREHIITLEDPIEYVFEPKGCHITQREVHTHTRSFAVALRGALREDPDVIMIGEMRDLETISLAITAAETGHLVLGTLHTSNASRTLDRLLDVFPPGQQEQIRIMVSESLRGVISQQLIPRVDGQGRVLALETLTNTPAVANVIREAKTYMLPGIIQTGKKQGMQVMDDALLALVDRGVISGEEALVRAEQKQSMREHLTIKKNSTADYTD